jgi:fatty acyl-CoA reductase
VFQVEVIFHSAATVKFDEHIRIAYETNIRGTEEVIKLAEEMKNIQVEY